MAVDERPRSMDGCLSSPFDTEPQLIRLQEITAPFPTGTDSNLGHETPEGVPNSDGSDSAILLSQGTQGRPQKDWSDLPRHTTFQYEVDKKGNGPKETLLMFTAHITDQILQMLGLESI